VTSDSERRAIAKTSDEIVKLDKKVANNYPLYKLVWGAVTDMDSGPPATLTIKPLGSSKTVSKIRYLSAYSPTVGDSIVGKKYGKDLVVLDCLKKPVAPLAIFSISGIGNITIIDMNANVAIAGGHLTNSDLLGLGSISPDGKTAIVSGTKICINAPVPALTPTSNAGSVGTVGSAVDSANPQYAYSLKNVIESGSDGVVYKVDLSTSTLVSTLDLAAPAEYCTMDPVNQTLYVTGGYGSVTFIDTNTFTVGDTVTGLPDAGGSSYMIVDPAGEYLYVTCYDAQAVVQIDIESRTISNVYTGSGEYQPSGVAVNADGTRIYVVDSGDQVINIFDNSLSLITSSSVVDGVGAALAYREGSLYTTGVGGPPDYYGYCFVLDATTDVLAVIASIVLGDVEVVTMAASAVS
jgi:DNA-binding beta-propeller fold protein YncE